LKEENKLNANTINSRVSPVKKFYDTNDIELKWKRIKSYVGKGRNKKYKKDRPYTHLEIQKMLEKADQRGRIAILLMSSSGIRVGALTSLKLRNLERIDKYNIYKITVYENEDEEYITFCTPECAAAIDSYLKYRQRHGEQPLNESAPVIREEFDINDEIRATRPRTLAVQSFRKMIRDIGLRSGVMEKMPMLEEVTEGIRQRRPVKETHGFRKFFQTTAINNGMSPLYTEILMGHHSGGLALESYVRPSELDLLEGNDRMTGFIGILDALTLNEENRLKRKVETLTEKQDEIQKMKAKHEQEMKAIREEMKAQQDQTVNRLLSILAKEAKEGKTIFDKETFKSLVNGENASLSLFTTDCDYNYPIFFSATAKDILPVKKALEEKASDKTASVAASGSS
jgi:integrase